MIPIVDNIHSLRFVIVTRMRLGHDFGSHRLKYHLTSVITSRRAFDYCEAKSC